MKHKKITSLSDNAPNQPSKFKTKNWVEQIMNHTECTTC